MNRTQLKEMAYKQQVNHLAQAQIQALKILIEQQQPCKLTVDNALSYLDLVKLRLGPQQFSEFLQIMRENRSTNSDSMMIVSKVCHLFKNYPELLQGFGMFLPPSINLQVQTAGRFLAKGEKDEIFPLFIKAEDDSYDPNRSTESTLTAVSESDSTMEDLLEDNDNNDDDDNDNDETEKVESVSKEIKETDKIDTECAVNYLAKVKNRFQDQPEVYDKFLQILESVRKDCIQEERMGVETDVFNQINDLFQTHEDLIDDFVPFVPNATIPDPFEQYPFPEDPNAELESQFQNEVSVSYSDSEDEISNYTLVNDPSLAAVAKCGSFDEHFFFDKVREALHHKEVYDNFLRCLNLFNEDVVTRSELLKIATSFLGKFPDLLKEFKDMLGFNESGNNIEAIPLKIINYENCRRDPEIALDIDYATGGRSGASYRALPKDMKQPKCSGRTQLCKEVLNDTWVSFPSWSEDSTFVTSCKTEFEEMIYRCEDERFELDMAIRANTYTIQALENVQRKINKMTQEEKCVFSLDDTLGGTSTVLHQKALHRCYGEKTDELVEGLKRNPIVAVPIILKRLRGKEEEWEEKQRQFDDIWREQMDHYYIKSLDHQGINFKQNDSKSFRSKSLLNEMEMVSAEKKENKVVSCSTPHFLLEFKEMCVFLDAINLICQYLKKLPGIFRDDRRRIELVVRHFISDFFCFPRATKAEEEAVDEDEEEETNEVEDPEEEQPPEAMDIDNDNEERSGQTSPSENAMLSKDEFSDAEESNSVEENEVSDESDKNSFIEDSDIFDKLDTVLPTNLPYTLFFVNKTWYVFFRQFHILCERLSRLLFESKRKDISSPVKIEPTDSGDESILFKPSYEELISKLSQLLSGAIDYSQFEDEARSLFGIHAFVSFTMDKLVLNIVRQLQQIVGDDVCKQCTSFFFQHNKVITNGSYNSPLESSQVENEYLKKVERIMNEEKCFKVLWHKKDQTLTIELIEHVIEHIDDPYEIEKWSNYLDSYVTEDSVSNDMLSEVPGLPVILPRNLRRQQEYWKRKISTVESSWKKYAQTSLKKKSSLLKRKSYDQSSPIPYKSSLFPKRKLDESISVCSEVPPTSEDVAQKTQSEQETIEVIECDKTVESTSKFDDTSKTSEKSNETDGVRLETEMDTGEFVNELNVSENSNQSTGTKSLGYDSVKSFTEEKTLFYCNTSEASNESSMMLCNQLVSFTGSEKGDNDTFDSNEGSMYMKDEDQQIDSVAAFHDVSEVDTNVTEADSDIVVAVQQESSESIELVTVDDSGDDINVVSDTESVDKKEKVVEPKESESRPRREKAAKRYAGIKPRKSRSSHEYVRRRNKRNAAKAQKDKKLKHTQKEEEEFDFSTFDYEYFSKLSEEDKCLYLAMDSLLVSDDTEGKFKRENFKLVFVQNCDMHLLRLNCLLKAKEIHQRVSEIKTSNFNAWHRVWLDRYVTPTMWKFCNEWLLKSDPEKFKLVCVTMSDCTKPPYIPYSKYRVRYYKTDS